jgi:ATP-binding cassette subfamily F protein 3
MIEIKDLTLRVAGRILLENATAILPERAKIGFVGRNGAGKTTLLKTLQGDFQFESGNIGFTKDDELKYVRQEIENVDLSPLEYLVSSVKIEEEEYKLARQIEAQGAKILKGLGFSDETMNLPLAELSGGWRMRVMLACIFIGRPGVLLLDEPTNHLDLEAVLWLKSYLKTYPGTILMVSHDKTLLNDVCDHILHLEDKKLFFYTGNYDRFSKLRTQKMEHLQSAQKKIAEKRAHMQDFVNRFKATASKAKQAQSRMKMIEKLENVYIPLDDSSALNISFPEPSHLPMPLVSIYNASFGYEQDKAILKRVSLRIDPGDRIAILGPNGNGKSTFANYLAGVLPFEEGNKDKATHLKIGYFYQHQIDMLDLSKTPTELLEEKLPKASEVQLRNQLARFGLEANKAITPLKNLSGGEKARLNLAIMCAFAPNLIILDEPTNHLDLDTKEALGDALMDFEGAVIVISHDQEFLEKIVDQIWIAQDQTVSIFEGTLEDYEKSVLARTQEKKVKGGKNAPQETPQTPVLDKGKLEKKLKELETKKVQTEAFMASPEFYNAPPQDQKTWGKNYQELLKDIENLEKQWLES